MVTDHDEEILSWLLTSKENRVMVTDEQRKSRLFWPKIAVKISKIEVYSRLKIGKSRLKIMY